MIEAALEIHGQRGRGRHSPRDWGSEPALECPLTHPFALLTRPAGSVGAGGGLGPWWPPSQGHSLISRRKARHVNCRRRKCQAPLGVFGAGVNASPQPAAAPELPCQGLYVAGGVGVGERGLGKGNPRVSPPLLFPNLLGANPPQLREDPTEATAPGPEEQHPLLKDFHLT